MIGVKKKTSMFYKKPVGKKTIAGGLHSPHQSLKSYNMA